MSPHYTAHIQVVPRAAGHPSPTLPPQREISSRVHQAALTTIARQEAPAGSSLTIVLSHDEHLQQLNRQFAAVDTPTDVLSFPSAGSSGDKHYLGDIIISVDRAQAQAHTLGHSLIDELQLLTVHGTLHLLGHNHAAVDEKARMSQAQAKIIAELGKVTSVLARGSETTTA